MAVILLIFRPFCLDPLRLQKLTILFEAKTTQKGNSYLVQATSDNHETWSRSISNPIGTLQCC